jgi:hypothetical protein
MPRSVAIIFDSDFSDRLGKVAFRTPVWIVDTPANRAAAEEAWHATVDWPHITVTLFRPSEEQAKEDWRALLDQVKLHERAVDVIEVIGAPLTLTARAVLAESGLARFEETSDGFRAKREKSQFADRGSQA